MMLNVLRRAPQLSYAAIDTSFGNQQSRWKIFRRLAIPATNRHYDYQQQQSNDGHRQGGSESGRSWWSWRTFRRGAVGTAPPLLAFGWWDTIKDATGIEPVRLDNHPIKHKVKQAMLLRKHNRYVEALDVLQEALTEAKDSKVEGYVTRIYDEIANTYYEMGETDKAFDLFREIVERLIRLHEKNETSPEFIGISLKIADILARRGDIENAEIGFKHCVSKQLQAVEEHQKKYLVSKGAVSESSTPADSHGILYSDPLALFGMALEAYAYFLLDNFGSQRLQEVEEYMDEVLKICHHLYGSCSSHTVYLINNFGARCVHKNQPALARKYLEIALVRVLNLTESEPILISYYCNYAEALFHTGDEARAVEFARKAERFARAFEPRVQRYAEKFRREMERDARRAGAKVPPAEGEKAGGWRSWLPI